MKAPGFKNRLDLIELSDAFRRHAQFDNEESIRTLVKEAQKVAVLSTYYHGETPNLPANRETDNLIREQIVHLAGLAKQMGVDELVLPHTGDRRSWNARRIQDKVLDGLDLPVKVVLQTEEYDRDMSPLGNIDKRIKTALDLGIRGVMSIDQNLRARWDNPRLSPQDFEP